jgi:hypothetical protein
MRDGHEWDHQKVADVVCHAIATSSTSIPNILKAGYQDNTLPDYNTFARWLNEVGQAGDELRDQYARAKEQQMDFLAEQILEIADTSVEATKTVDSDENGRTTTTTDAVDRSRLKVDARKWLMSKLKPKKYGDRTTLAGDPDSPLELGVKHMIAGSDELLKKIRGGK